MNRILVLMIIFVLSAGVATTAAGNPPAPPIFVENFLLGYRVFDDGVGVLRVRQSGSTVETDYAPGITAPTPFYARLTVQPWLQIGTPALGVTCPPPPFGSPTSFCGINGDQTNGTCTPGAVTSNNSFSCEGPFTEWGLPFGGFDGAFDTAIPFSKAGATTSIQIYLDTAFAAPARASVGSTDYRFDWDADLLDSKGTYLQDYIFNVATGQNTDACAPASGGFYVIEASTNSQRSGANAHNPTPPNPPQACISASGWYTFVHIFKPDKSKNLEVDMLILDSHAKVVAGWTLHPTCMGSQATENLCTSGGPLPFSAVGGNFLGWFPDQEINDLAITNIVRTPL